MKELYMIIRVIGDKRDNPYADIIYDSVENAQRALDNERDIKDFVVRNVRKVLDWREFDSPEAVTAEVNNPISELHGKEIVSITFDNTTLAYNIFYWNYE